MLSCLPPRTVTLRAAVTWNTEPSAHPAAPDTWKMFNKRSFTKSLLDASRCHTAGVFPPGDAVVFMMSALVSYFLIAISLFSLFLFFKARVLPRCASLAPLYSLGTTSALRAFSPTAVPLSWHLI